MRESRVGRDKVREIRDTGSCRPWNPFKESVLHQEQVGSHQRVLNSKVWAEYEARAAPWECTVLPSLPGLLRQDSISLVLTVGGPPGRYKEEVTEAPRAFVLHTKSHTSREQRQGLKLKKKRRNREVKKGPTGREPVWQGSVKDSIIF